MPPQSQIQIRADEIFISEGEPYQFDRLGRKPSCDLLTRFATCVLGPCTIAIDAPWGYGKTTFLKLWAADLKKNNFSVIEVNAWKTDYFNDPLLAIFGEMTKELKAINQSDSSTHIGLTELKKWFIKLTSIAVPRIIAHHTGLTDEDLADLATLFETNPSERLEQYEEQLSSVENFRSELQNVAEKVRSQTEKPLIVLIDELDRCRPTYAIEFLEAVKHLMAVNHIIYAYAMNRSELAHAVSGCYGSEFDGKGYLRRFFDIDFTLPLPSRREFIHSFFMEKVNPLIPEEGAQHTSKCLLQAFFGEETINLRQIQQALYRFRLILMFAQQDTARPPSYTEWIEKFCVALILHVYDPDMLRNFLRGKISDRDVVAQSLPSAVKDNRNLLQERRSFEVTIIQAAQEIAGSDRQTGKYIDTPLLQSYRKLIDSPTHPNHEIDPERKFAESLVRRIEDHPGPEYWHPRDNPRRFRYAVKQIEMLQSLTNSRV